MLRHSPSDAAQSTWSLQRGTFILGILLCASGVLSCIAGLAQPRASEAIVLEGLIGVIVGVATVIAVQRKERALLLPVIICLVSGFAPRPLRLDV